MTNYFLENEDRKKEGSFSGFLEEIPQGIAQPELNDSEHSFIPSLLHFSTETLENPVFDGNFRTVQQRDLNYLNRYSTDIQRAAKYYLENLSGETFHYIFKEKDKQVLEDMIVSFQAENFAHLVGIRFENENVAQTLEDLAHGKLEQSKIYVKRDGSTKSKVQVIGKLEELFKANAISMNDLSSVAMAKSDRLNFQDSIRSEDKELLMAIRTVSEDEKVPVSILNLSKPTSSSKFDLVPENTILSIWKEYEEGGIGYDLISYNEQYMNHEDLAFTTMMLSNLSVQRQPEKESEEKEETPVVTLFKSIFDLDGKFRAKFSNGFLLKHDQNELGGWQDDLFDKHGNKRIFDTEEMNFYVNTLVQTLGEVREKVIQEDERWLGKSVKITEFNRENDYAEVGGKYGYIFSDDSSSEEYEYAKPKGRGR